MTPRHGQGVAKIGLDTYSAEVAPVLSIADLSIHFQGLKALNGVSFTICPGQICGLIGPNGAGKTTLFNCITRIYQPTTGSIKFRGNELLTHARHEVVGLGLSRTFQNLALFGSMSVLDNVLLGAHCRTKSSYLGNMLKSKATRREEKQLVEIAGALLEYLRLGDVIEKNVSDLPFGTRKRVEIARALISEPSLLLLDEPAGGLNHDEIAEFGDLIMELRDKRGITVLIVEHHMGLIMRISDHVVALNFGQLMAQGTPAQIQTNPEVIGAYLGGVN